MVADGALWGFGDDCISYGTYLYGNTFWRNGAGGIYHEAWCDDTRILYNVVVENGGWGHGIMLSAAFRTLVAYNLIRGNTGFGIGCFRRLNAPELLAEVWQGVRFVDGVRVPDRPQAAAA